MAMVCSGPNGLDAITISSNPRAVGICGGYACKERLSVFYVVGAKGQYTMQILYIYIYDTPNCIKTFTLFVQIIYIYYFVTPTLWQGIYTILHRFEMTYIHMQISVREKILILHYILVVKIKYTM